MIFLSRVPLCPWISCLVFRGDAAARCCPRSRGREVKIQKIFTRVILSVAKCESATLEPSDRAGLRIYIFCVFIRGSIFSLTHNMPSVETVKLTEQIRTAAKKVEVGITKRNGFSWQPGAADTRGKLNSRQTAAANSSVT